MTLDEFVGRYTNCIFSLFEKKQHFFRPSCSCLGFEDSSRNERPEKSAFQAMNR